MDHFLSFGLLATLYAVTSWVTSVVVKEKAWTGKRETNYANEEIPVAVFFQEIKNNGRL